ncbi:hypothetical protein [Streptomyces flaveolus]|uniref:hypothetical protein n=1 Tax=Streptomyces flaveolus TaxID=67297 RepID=UPI0033E4758F
MPDHSLTRRERLTIIRAVLGGVVYGTARALTTWLLAQLFSYLCDPTGAPRALGNPLHQAA